MTALPLLLLLVLPLLASAASVAAEAAAAGNPVPMRVDIFEAGTDTCTALPLSITVDNWYVPTCEHPWRDLRARTNDRYLHCANMACQPQSDGTRQEVTCPSSAVTSLAQAALPTAQPYVTIVSYTSADCTGDAVAIDAILADGMCHKMGMETAVRASCPSTGAAAVRVCIGQDCSGTCSDVERSMEACVSVNRASTSGRTVRSERWQCINGITPSLPPTTEPSSNSSAGAIISRTDVWLPSAGVSALVCSGATTAFEVSWVATGAPSNCVNQGCTLFGEVLATQRKCLAPDNIAAFRAPTQASYVVVDMYSGEYCAGTLLKRTGYILPVDGGHTSAPTCNVIMGKSYTVQCSHDGTIQIAQCENTDCTSCTTFVAPSGGCMNVHVLDQLPVFGVPPGLSAHFTCTNLASTDPVVPYPTALVPSSRPPSQTSYVWRMDTYPPNTCGTKSSPAVITIDNASPVPCLLGSSPTPCTGTNPTSVSCPAAPVSTIPSLTGTGTYIALEVFATESCATDIPLRMHIFHANGQCLHINSETAVKGTCSPSGQIHLSLCTFGCDTCTTVYDGPSTDECVVINTEDNGHILFGQFHCVNPSEDPVGSDSSGEILQSPSRTEVWVSSSNETLDCERVMDHAAPTFYSVLVRPQPCENIGCSVFGGTAQSVECLSPSYIPTALRPPIGPRYVTIDAYDDLICSDSARTQRLGIISRTVATCVALPAGDKHEQYIQAICSSSGSVIVNLCGNSACSDCTSHQHVQGSCVAASEFPGIDSGLLPLHGSAYRFDCKRSSAGDTAPSSTGVSPAVIAGIVVGVVVGVSVLVAAAWWLHQRYLRVTRTRSVALPLDDEDTDEFDLGLDDDL